MCPFRWKCRGVRCSYLLFLYNETKSLKYGKLIRIKIRTRLYRNFLEPFHNYYATIAYTICMHRLFLNYTDHKRFKVGFPTEVLISSGAYLNSLCGTWSRDALSISYRKRCRYLNPFFYSRCRQLYRRVHVIAYCPRVHGFIWTWIRVPSCCRCERLMCGFSIQSESQATLQRS